jgi:regulatory protein
VAWAFITVKQQPSLKAQAMRFLARREHSRAELKRKLAPRAAEADDVEAILDDLAKRGWLSDVRFAELTARAKARRFGPAKVAHFLRSRGVDEESIAAGVAAAGVEACASMQAIWASRFKELPTGEKERARQVRFLQGRGFALDDIFRFMKDCR